jgi:hypothetical protein
VSSPSTCRSCCEVRRPAEGVGAVQHLRVRNAEFIGSFAENSAHPIGFAARHAEPYGQRRLGGTRNMTVACDGGAGAQAGVRHRGGRHAAPTERRETHTVASVFCFSFSMCRSYCELQRSRAQRGPERPNLEDPFFTGILPVEWAPLRYAPSRAAGWVRHGT